MTEVQASKVQDDGGGAAPEPIAPIWIAFVMVLATLSAIGAVSYRSVQEFAASVRWVADTYIVIEHLKTVLETSDAAVSAERLYVLTGDPSRLQPVTIGRAFGAGQMRKLAELTADDHEQQQRFGELQPLLDQQMSLLDQVVAIRTRRGRDAALSFLLDHKMPELLARIHSLVTTMIAAENRLLDRRADTVLSDARFALRVLLIDTVGAFCVVLFAAFYIRRTIARLHRMSGMVSCSEKNKFGGRA